MTRSRALTYRPPRGCLTLINFQGTLALAAINPLISVLYFTQHFPAARESGSSLRRLPPDPYNHVFTRLPSEPTLRPARCDLRGIGLLPSDSIINISCIDLTVPWLSGGQRYWATWTEVIFNSLLTLFGLPYGCGTRRDTLTCLCFTTRHLGGGPFFPLR